MILQNAMCLILLYPLYLSFAQCKQVLSGNFTSFLSGTLVKFKIPKIVVIIISLLLSIAIILLIVLVMSMKAV